MSFKTITPFRTGLQDDGFKVALQTFQQSVNFISIFLLGDTLTVGDDTIDRNNQIGPANILEIASLLFISKRIYATIATTIQLNDHLGTQWRPLF